MEPRKLIFCLAAACLFAQAEPTDPGWPRVFSDGQARLVIHQPQIESWTAFKHLKGRCAFALTSEPGSEEVFGTFRFDGETLVDVDRRMVLLRGIRKHGLRFPSATAAEAARWEERAGRLMPSDALVLSLDRVLAFMRASEFELQETAVRTDPPPIYASTSPAVLVILDGPPVFIEAETSGMRRIVNTNWPLYQARTSRTFYLRHGDSWLKAADLQGSFVRATEVPTELARLPLPQAGAATGNDPRVIVVEQPAELIVTRGEPKFAPVVSPSLLSVTNTESDLFYETKSRAYYYLTSGRWFRAESLQGPWVFASNSLPEPFRLIPAAHPQAHVLAAVPGTREAEDAVLLAAIPRTDAVSRRDAKADVQYAGSPDFTPIANTGVSYARNTPSDVLLVGGRYFLCVNAVWFVSATPTGPWVVADSVPAAIYTIPSSSPKYHVTHVRIQGVTAEDVVVGYTPGYYGAYVSHGVVVWGTGFYHAPYVGVVGAAPVYWGVPHYTYGAGAWYNPATGVYARGAVAYGPYGGHGAAAAYDPRTGTYREGTAARAANGNATAGYRASNAYGNWGQGVATNGSDWARGGYQSTARGTVAAGETSKGGVGMAVSGAGGNQGYVAKSGSGDIYAGANGNVYKRDNGQWYQNQGGSWNTIDRSALDAQRQQAAARDHGTRNAERAQRGQSQRPQPPGRRR